jgi:hypothetical protein
VEVVPKALKAYPCRPYFQFLQHLKAVLALQVSATARPHDTEISDEPPCIVRWATVRKIVLNHGEFQEGSGRAVPFFPPTVLHAGILDQQKKKPEE